MSFIYMDANGRKVIGEVIEETELVVKLKDPIIVNESIQPGPDGNGRVDLSFAPYIHSFEVYEAELKWFSKLKCDPTLHRAYEDFTKKIQAKRSGIDIVSSLPGNMPRVG